MSKQSIKRRRKLPFKSDDGQDINFGFIVLVIATGISISAVLYTIFMRYHVNSPIHDKANEVGEYDIRKYQDIIARAEYYSRTYQNLSKLSVVDFYHSLRGHRFPKAAEMTVSNANQIEIPSIESSFKTNTGSDRASSRGVMNMGDAFKGMTSMISNSLLSYHKNLVIGIAQNIDSKNLAVFCATADAVLRPSSSSSPSTDIVLFINTPISSKSREILTKYKIEYVEYSLLQTIEEKYRSYHPSSLRWILLQQYFQSKKAKQELQYDQVLLIDVRDSYFQGNPFEKHSSSYFNVYQGVDTLTISQCGWNGGWIKDCFGRDVLDQVGNMPIICSGVSMGTLDNILTYVEFMSDTITGSPGPRTAEIMKEYHPKFPTCERNGVDQGVHNVLVHKKLISNIKIVLQKDSTILNMQAKKGTFDEVDYVVKNMNGHLATVVHQYDRFHTLQKYLFKKYVDWVDTNDEDAVWNEEKWCKLFKKEQDKDLFKGVCDYRNQGGASTAATCCSVCMEFRKYCKAFTFSGGVCYLKSCGLEQSEGNSVMMSGAVSAYRINTEH